MNICDISKNQGRINWAELAPNLDFIIIKASGKSADPMFSSNVTNAVLHKIPFHVYHFVYSKTETAARDDARLFYETVKKSGKWPYVWVLDLEAGWGVKSADAPRLAAAFENELRALARENGPGEIRIAAYIAQQKYYDWAIDYSRFYYIWIPGYGEKFKPQMPCDMWQYTDKGRLPGIKNNVDLNVLIGDKPLEYFTGIKAAKAMFTNKQLVAFCEKVYKAAWVYWYGTYGLQCTNSLYKSKKKQYKDHYTAARASGYKRDIAAGKWCADCVGLIKAFFWSGGEFEKKPTYASNGCPDVSANGMIKRCNETGPIKSIPDIPGLVVWRDGHIGVYIGGGYTIEMRGFDYDCQKRKVTDGTWTKWGKLPASMLEYVADEQTAPIEGHIDGLKRGDYGNAVTAMQKALLKWDANCLPKYGADGDFGTETEKALKAYQKAVALPVTGVYDEQTRLALSEAKPVTSRFVVVTGNSVNVRTAPDAKNGRVIGVVYKGDKLTYQGEDSADGWHLVEYNGQNAWISGKYSKLE